MAKIVPLLRKLDEVSTKERNMFVGYKERESFIETFGSKSFEELLEEFNPTYHNSNWDKERQKTPCDLEALMRERRSIAFMVAGQKGIHKHYKESEIIANQIAAVSMTRNISMIKNTYDFVSMYTYKKG
jgi:hypothetical protein